MTKEQLRARVTEWRARCHTGQRWWSVAHHGALFGSILSSVAAGALLQVQSQDWVGTAAVLTSVAAALTSLAASGGFERKWRSNRLSRSQLDGLLLDLEGDSPDLPAAIARLKDIIAAHDREVVRADAEEEATRGS